MLTTNGVFALETVIIGAMSECYVRTAGATDTNKYLTLHY